MTTATIELLPTEAWEEDSDASWAEVVAADDVRCDTRTLDDANLLVFGENLRAFITASAEMRHLLRPELEYDLKHAPRPARYIHMALDDFVASAVPGRLDDAIDLLATIEGAVLSTFLWRGWRQDERYSDDHWYVLILALSRKDESSLNRLYPTLMSSPRRAVHEAVVEALGHCGNSRARQRLSHISETDESAFVRELAVDWLEELGE